MGECTGIVGAVGQRHLVLDARHGRQQLEVVLALEALANDVHVEQPEESAAEPEPEGVGGLRLPAQRRVVQRELLERVAQVGVVVGVDREQPAEHHRLDLAVAGQRLGSGPRPPGKGRERVADPQFGDVLDAGDQVADLAGVERVGGRHRRGEESDVVDLGLGRGLHRTDRLALREGPVDHADVRDHPAVLVELGIEDQRPRWRVGLAGRRRDPRDQLVQHLEHPLPRLRADPPHALGGLPEQLSDLRRDPLGLGSRQVDLVQARDQLEPRVDRQVRVGHRLRLDPLRGVDHQQRAFAGGERARHLVGEVDVSRRVDQVQLVGLAVARGLEEHADRLRLDRDPALALELHRVEQLRAHQSRIDGVGQLENPVSERRLAVVDVGNDREVADVSLVGHLLRGYLAAGARSDYANRASHLGSSPSSLSTPRPATPIPSSPPKIATASIDLRPCLSQ